MDSNWEHQKKAVATDQTRADDEHLRELDKRHLKETEKDGRLIPKPAAKTLVDKQE